MLTKDNKKVRIINKKINQQQIFKTIIENVIATVCRYSQTIKL